ncbi:hypothetical protein ACSVHC_07210 [Arthrobacter sp. KNU-44]|uniref:hypothetical protein n=1 Tax=Arthrobacter sp. KNU-44 TaxID=3450744 RepID=UPI003F436826
MTAETATAEQSHRERPRVSRLRDGLLREAFGCRVASLLRSVPAVVTLLGLTTVRVAVPVGRPSLREQFRPLASPAVLAAGICWGNLKARRSRCSPDVSGTEVAA